MRLLRAILLGQVLTGLTAGLPADGQVRGSSVRIASPAEGDIVAGPTVFSATIDPPTLSPRRVEFFMDGVSVCRITAAPFECTYEAPLATVPRAVSVVATLADGRQLLDRLRTTGLDAVVETTGAQLVYVPVRVTDERGRSVTGLTEADFVIEEDGEVQPISFFQATDVQLDVAVAVDISASMSRVLDEVATAVGTFVDGFKPTDRVSLLAFNQDVYALARPGAAEAERRDALESLVASGGTALYDAILGAIGTLHSGISRRAVVVFSDGEDAASRATLRTLEQRLGGSDVALFAIVLETEDGSSRSRELLLTLARRSGGQAHVLEKIDDLQAVLHAIQEDLVQHYLLAYQPARSLSDGAFHAIDVHLPLREDAVIRARDGYVNSR